MAAVNVLRGITWGHSRGYLPLVAAAQRFAELHPGVEIAWEKRSLKAFEEFPVEQLAATYDLLVIDHPFVDYAARHDVFLPLDEHLSRGFLDDQAANAVGLSHASYEWKGHHWALAIDAATPVACWRPDLLARHGLERPATWDQLLLLARDGWVELPAAPINCLMNFYSLCRACGEEPFLGSERVVGHEAGAAALAALGALVSACDPDGLGRNPIDSYERMSRAGEQRAAYCPLTYGYSNYARDGYAEARLEFGDVVSFGDRGLLATTLGGTGLAVSARSLRRREAVAFAEFAASGTVQRTLACHAGGQPGHRSAWTDPENNRIAHNYFRSTLPTLDRAWLRPRFSGYLHFQECGGTLVHDVVAGRRSAREALLGLDGLYREALSHA